MSDPKSPIRITLDLSDIDTRAVRAGADPVFRAALAARNLHLCRPTPEVVSNALRPLLKGCKVYLPDGGPCTAAAFDGWCAAIAKACCEAVASEVERHAILGEASLGHLQQQLVYRAFEGKADAVTAIADEVPF